MANERVTKYKWLFGLIGVILVVWVIYAVFSPAPIMAEIGVVKVRPYLQTFIEDGETRAKEIFDVIAPVSGDLNRVHLKEGDPVNQGDVLAEIIPSESSLLDLRTKNVLEKLLISQQAALSKTIATQQQADYAKQLAFSEYQRNAPLVKGKHISEFEFEQSKLHYQESEKAYEASTYDVEQIRYQKELIQVALQQFTNELAMNKNQLQVFHVRAPTNGKVLKIARKSGGAIQAGSPILTLADPNDLEIVVDLLTTDAIQIPPHAEAIIKRWGGKQDLKAKVRLVEPHGFTKVSTLGVEEQRVNVILDIMTPKDVWKKLGNGYRVDVEVILFSSDRELTVPISALFRVGEDWAVFKVVGNKVKSQPVKVKMKNDQLAVISEGLAENDQVILYPSDQIKDGVRIQAMK